MPFKKIFLSISILSLLFSCNTTPAIDDTIKTDSIIAEVIDTITPIVEVDTTSTLADSLVKDGYVEETKELSTVIEKKYGKQWDFCDCVVKNDSINKAMSNLDDVSDEDVDKLFLRWDVIESHCKELLTAPNTTPEERSKYKRKVKKCLRKAGIK